MDYKKKLIDLINGVDDCWIIWMIYRFAVATIKTNKQTNKETL